ncbi:hypothetical protein PV-S19_0294 [Pacmanvirus S19]|nr:hypothetical protein PV-S19_0294 [Pacmanvirus S19]
MLNDVSDKATLEQQLREWVTEKEKNGIKQHDIGWHEAKVLTIGGSSLATVQGKNPYSNVFKIISEKIGLSKFNGDIKTQWGNLFEDVIKRYVEEDKKCTVLGEDLFVVGPPGTSYSPDGLTVLDHTIDEPYEEETIIDTPDGPQKSINLITLQIPKTSIVLVEFKCPYSRIPNGRPPVYYIPQVKMGLDLLQIPTIGLFIEGVFRRCSWLQLGNNPLYDRKLVNRSSGKLPLAYGIIGFYFNYKKFESIQQTIEIETQKNKMFEEYVEEFIEFGDSTNKYMSNDLGDSSPELFTMIMNLLDKKVITARYGDIVVVNDKYDVDIAYETVNNNLADFDNFCKENDYINLGILPWKLFRIDYNFINKEENYLEPWLSKINEIIDVVRECNIPENIDDKMNIYNSYINRSTEGGFSDE